MSNRTIGRRKVSNALFGLLALLAIFSSLLALTGLLIDVVVRGAGSVDLQFLSSAPSRIPAKAGIFPALIGTLWVTILVAIITFPIGVAAAIYLEEYAGRGRWARIMKLNISNLAGVPSIVYGIFGLGIIWLARTAPGRLLVAGGLALLGAALLPPALAVADGSTRIPNLPFAVVLALLLAATGAAIYRAGGISRREATPRSLLGLLSLPGEATLVFFTLAALPLGVYVASYLPWAALGNQLITGWPIGNTGQTLTDLTTRALGALVPVLEAEKPDLVIAQGDTTTTFVASLAAFYAKAKFLHVEAGLRTDNKWNPFPEEMNRRLTGRLTDFHCAPTELSAANLRAEGVDPATIRVTGNTVVDALHLVVAQDYAFEDAVVQAFVDTPGRIVLVTAHRRENWGERLQDIGRGFRELLERYPDTALLLPLHRNPTVREPLQALLGDHPRAFLVEPLDYDQLVAAMRGCTLLLSDSGGLQEEAPALGKPVLVLRRTTERPEAVDAGTAKLIGTASADILREASLLLEDPNAYDAMARAHNPFGDGKASERIVEVSRRFLTQAAS